jgi:nucleoside-diphosphate-sugar epimerase
MANAWHRIGVLDRLIIARPHNIYGPDMGREHVIPEFCIRMNGLIADHEPDPVPFPIQGTGMETRSFCHISACVSQFMFLLASAPQGAEIFNIGTMDEHTIGEVAHDIADVYGREIKLMPGTLPKGSPPRRLPDMTKMLALGWEGGKPWAEGLAETVSWYQSHG